MKGDFLRVGVRRQPAKSLTRIDGTLDRCGSPCSQMAKVELYTDVLYLPDLAFEADPGVHAVAVEYLDPAQSPVSRSMCAPSVSFRTSRCGRKLSASPSRDSGAPSSTSKSECLWWMASANASRYMSGETMISIRTSAFSFSEERPT